MARAQVCRFYDDAGRARARGAKVRVAEFENAAYGVYGRVRKSGAEYGYGGVALALGLPRAAVVQAVAVLFVVCVVLAGGVGSVLDGVAARLAPPAAPRAPGARAAARVAVAPALVREGVSLVAVCMGRHETVKKTVPAWLSVKGVDELIVVDWSSEPPLAPVIRALEGGERVTVIRVNGEKDWVLSRAYNLAVNATSRTHVIRTDCDYEVGPEFVAAHQALMNASGLVGNVDATAADAPDADAIRNGKFYFAGNYKLARNENEVHLNGAVYIRRKDFLDIGGYDERIQTYGWDDEDLYSRLNAAGLAKMNVSYDHVSHVQHGNSGRAQTGVKFVAVEIDLNSLLVEQLPKWRANLPSATRYELSKPAANANADPNTIEVLASSKPKALKDLVSEEEYNKAWTLALGRRLHDSYAVPWDMIGALPMDHQERLLRRLMQRSENREKVARQQLDAAGRADEMVNVDALPIPRILVCHCMHGLGNRLRALGSCMSFAKETSRELVVVWEADSHIEAKYGELFKTPLVVLDSLTVAWPFAEVEKWDAVWSQFKFHNYMEMEGQGAIKGEQIHDIPVKHMYYKGAYIIEAANPVLSNWEKDNEMLRSLEPVDEVATMLRSLEARGLGQENVVGMHIRNRTLEKDIKNVDFVSEYGDEATRTMDMWRRKSGVSSFITEMRRLIKEKPNVKFFIATDTFEVITQLEGLFGERVMAMKRTCDERDGACVRYALADLYALSKCKALYGSNWSSFTESAERLGGSTALLAGQHFAVDPPPSGGSGGQQS